MNLLWQNGHVWLVRFHFQHPDVLMGRHFLDGKPWEQSRPIKIKSVVLPLTSDGMWSRAEQEGWTEIKAQPEAQGGGESPTRGAALTFTPPGQKGVLEVQHSLTDLSWASDYSHPQNLTQGDIWSEVGRASAKRSKPSKGTSGKPQEFH